MGVATVALVALGASAVLFRTAREQVNRLADPALVAPLRRSQARDTSAAKIRIPDSLLRQIAVIDGPNLWTWGKYNCKTILLASVQTSYAYAKITSTTDFNSAVVAVRELGVNFMYNDGGGLVSNRGMNVAQIESHEQRRATKGCSTLVVHSYAILANGDTLRGYNQVK